MFRKLNFINGLALSSVLTIVPASALPVKKHTTIENLNAKSYKIVKDNNAALNEKIDVIEHAIKRAKSGEQNVELALNYYIYSTDHSSSYFSQKLIEAARAGVKINVILDMLQSYSRLDYYKMIEREGNGNIYFHFYGAPTKQIILDAIYLTTDCVVNGQNKLYSDVAGACQEIKKAKVDKIIENSKFGNVLLSNHKMAQLLLSGIYSKNVDIISKALLEGQKIDLDQVASGDAKMTDEEIAGLKTFVKALWKSKVSSNAFEKLVASGQVKLALMLYGNQLSPIYNMMTGAIPFTKNSDLANEQLSSSQKGKDWLYVTDFTHHKLITDGIRFVSGGRNIENSYHMVPNDLTDKYIFMDTDISVDLFAYSAQLMESQKKIIRFFPLVKNTFQLDSIMPNTEVSAYELATDECQDKTNKVCIDKALKKFSVERNRLDFYKNLMDKNASAYSEYANSRLASVDSNLVYEVKNSASETLSYLENLHFDRTQKLPTRIYGVKTQKGLQTSAGKDINEMWNIAIDEACVSNEPKELIFNNAYFLPSGEFLAKLAETQMGNKDCSNVNIKILTNSIETTDLAIVNLFARHWTKAFVDFSQSYGNKKSAAVEFYEYNKSKLGNDKNGGSNFSLHSKEAVLDNRTVLIGSANLDVRSFARDTNNAVLIQNSPMTANWLKSQLKNQIAAGVIVKTNSYFENISEKQLLGESMAFIDQLNRRKCYTEKGPYEGCATLNWKRYFALAVQVRMALSKMDKVLDKILINTANNNEKAKNETIDLYNKSLGPI